MATTKVRSYHRALQRAASIVNSDAGLKHILDSVVRGIARAMDNGVSLGLLDSSKKKLVHVSSWGLPKAYLQKGLVDVNKSLAEVTTGRYIAITNVAKDKRIQYPEEATKAGIVSILGVPIVIDGSIIGSIRVYSKQQTDFSKQDANFVIDMANLAAVAINQDSLKKQQESAYSQVKTRTLSRAQGIVFAHPSEEEFARILDFYDIEWVYEPRSFPLEWEGDRVVAMFTPDFYLPGLDIYIELTTLKRRLMTEKNRKIRRLQERYPEVKVTLLDRKDYDHLLAKYGVGPLAQSRAHGIDRVLYSVNQIEERVRTLAEQISKDYTQRRPILVGVQRGFLCFMADLIRQITIPVDLDFMAISYYGGEDDSAVKITKDMDLSVSGRHVLMVEDIVDTGITLNYIINYLLTKGPASLMVCTLLDRRVRRILDVPLKYVGFEVPEEFVVGYGLDYREEYRNLPFIGIPIIGKKSSGQTRRNKD